MMALRTTTILAGMLALGTLAAAPAMATTVTWTLGQDTYTNPQYGPQCGVKGTPGCNANSIGYGQATFASDSGDVPLILSAFSTVTTTTTTYVKGRPHVTTTITNNGPSQTQLAVSQSGVGATYAGLNNPDGEIEANEAILVDAAELQGKGYSLTNLTIGSITAGADFTIYALTSGEETAFVNEMNGSSGKAVLPPSGDLLLDGTEVSGTSYATESVCTGKGSKKKCTAPAASVNLGSLTDPYFLITVASQQCNTDSLFLTSATATGGSHNIPPVPEPASIMLMAVGVAGLGASRRWKRGAA